MPPKAKKSQSVKSQKTRKRKKLLERKLLEKVVEKYKQPINYKSVFFKAFKG